MNALLRLVKRMAVIVFLFYAMLLVTLYAFQRSMMYFPLKGVKPPAEYGLSGFSDVTLTTKDNVRVTAWAHAAEPGFPTVVFFHGNGGNISNRVDLLRAFTDAGYGMFSLDYRGYGNSEGTPSETGIYLDAHAAITYVSEKMQVPDGKMIFYGESLGTGVAVEMATQYQAGMVVLQSPYLSITIRASESYSYVPVSLLLKDRFDSVSKMGKLKSPLLIFHGDIDTIIPIAHGKALLAAAVEPKEAVYFPNVGHVEFEAPVLVERVSDFAKRTKLLP